MREIKFRAWDKRDNKIKYSQIANHYSDLIDVLQFPASNWECFILMQFTGLKDKNGVDIYEGDIIETDNSSYFKIIWDSDILGFKLTYDGLGDKGWFHVIEGHGGMHTWTVVGNIYETKF